MEQNQLPANPEPGRNEAQKYSVPWSAVEGWIGVLLLILINLGFILLINRESGKQLAQSALIVFAELAYILPVIMILAWKRVSWKHIGFGKFDWSTMGIGCGMLLGGYGVILVHNLIITALGVDTQGQAIFDIFSSLDSPV